MAPGLNKTVKYLRFLSREPVKRQEYQALLWNWNRHEVPRNSDIAEGINSQLILNYVISNYKTKY